MRSGEQQHALAQSRHSAQRAAHVQGNAKLELAGSVIFNFSDTEDLGAKQEASLMLGELSKQDLDPHLADGVHLRRRL